MDRKICSRQTDDLGRIVLPQEVRTELQIEPGAFWDIYSDGKTITLKRAQPYCVICNIVDSEFTQFNGKKICADCLEKIRR